MWKLHCSPGAPNSYLTWMIRLQVTLETFHGASVAKHHLPSFQFISLLPSRAVAGVSGCAGLRATVVKTYEMIHDARSEL